MAGSILGTAVRRVEDPELLLGRGTFVANLAHPGLLSVAFVRSPFAHAGITRVDIAVAKAMPGVVAVLTASDLGLGPYAIFKSLDDRCDRSPLSAGRVRYAGDPVALVVAEQLGQAIDAAEAVEVDYDPLPSVTDPEVAAGPDAPLIFADLGTNVVAGERSPAESDPFAEAEVVVRGRFENQRLAAAPIEANAIAVIPASSPGDPELDIHVSTQQPHVFRELCCSLLGLPTSAVRVIAPHVGGGFGGKVGLAPEYASVVAAAHIIRRPLRWIESRSENLVGMNGRGQMQYAEMGLRRDGSIVGLRFSVIGDAGAYGGFGGALPIGSTQKMSQGVYDVPRLVYDVATALTNTSPMGAVRGAGRPEASTMLERLVDLAADELEIDPVDLRRRNLIGTAQFPYPTTTGLTYDCGDYHRTLDAALERLDDAAVRAEQAARRASGDRWQIGVGIACYVEITNGMARDEFGAVEIHEDGTATVRAGTSAHGQGHATSFAMIVADRLRLPIEAIRYVQSDTAQVPFGGGTGGSRSLQLGGMAVSSAADLLLERARELASTLLEADVADIVLDDLGRIGVAGVPARAYSWSELAKVAATGGDDLAVSTSFSSGGATFPFGCHCSVVEVDLETGFVRPLRHVAVDDAGKVVNPLIFAGQQHGGIAQGIAQALYEEVRYDDDGNPVTGTFATYETPSAADLCDFDVAYTETLTPLNALGVKGIGEAGTTGATPAMQNAVVDAVSYLGVRHIDMPCTPERVWRAISEAAVGRSRDPWRNPPPVFAALAVRGAPRPTTEEDH